MSAKKVKRSPRVKRSVNFILMRGRSWVENEEELEV